MTATGPITPLTPTERRVAERLGRGMSLAQIADDLELSLHTVKSYAGGLRIKLHLPPRCAMPVLLHALITTEQITVSTPEQTAPFLDEQQVLLLRAVAANTGIPHIARAAGIPPADVRASVDALIATTGATDEAHMVMLGHTWDLLGPNADTASVGGGR
ncbi:helix-turn-helix transcriptional regulator [Streptomyces hirsutus]|uniref:helix-turn-helix domain-containing protein n=1 Tax=Streptomyces hirsutus TaxID=35620 RepID=UPI0033E65EBE